jgi:pimeloyl-ACP methyl ester carboxylesterase
LATQINGLADLECCVPAPSAWLTAALSVPREKGRIKVDDCEINFYRWGDPSNPGIIMLHGFLAHARCFAFIAPYLANDYHVVAYDMSGMGDSGWRDNYSEEVRIKELLGVCQKTGLFDDNKRPIIISHSYGGRVGSSAIHAHQHTFAGIIICDLMVMRPSVFEKHAEKFRAPGSLNDSSRPNNIYPDYAIAKKRFVLAPPQEVEHPELLDFMAYHSLKKVDGGWQWKFDRAVINRNNHEQKKWAQVGDLVTTLPVRKAVIYGQDSYLFNEDSLKYLTALTDQQQQQRIPIIGIPHARHHLMLDQPIAFVSTLKAVITMW